MAVYEQIKRSAYVLNITKALRKRGIKCYPYPVIDGRADSDSDFKMCRNNIKSVKLFLN